MKLIELYLYESSCRAGVNKEISKEVERTFILISLKRYNNELIRFNLIFHFLCCVAHLVAGNILVLALHHAKL